MAFFFAKKLQGGTGRGWCCGRAPPACGGLAGLLPAALLACFFVASSHPRFPSASPPFFPRLPSLDDSPSWRNSRHLVFSCAFIRWGYLCRAQFGACAARATVTHPADGSIANHHESNPRVIFPSLSRFVCFARYLALARRRRRASKGRMKNKARRCGFLFQDKKISTRDIKELFTEQSGDYEQPEIFDGPTSSIILNQVYWGID